MAKKPVGRPPLKVPVRCLWPNVWTSAGKLYRGDEAEVTTAEAEALDAADAVKIVRDK